MLEDGINNLYQIPSKRSSYTCITQAEEATSAKRRQEGDIKYSPQNFGQIVIVVIFGTSRPRILQNPAYKSIQARCCNSYRKHIRHGECDPQLMTVGLHLQVKRQWLVKWFQGYGHLHCWVFSTSSNLPCFRCPQDSLVLFPWFFLALLLLQLLNLLLFLDDGQPIFSSLSLFVPYQELRLKGTWSPILLY